MPDEISITEIIANLQSANWLTRLHAAGDLIEYQDERVVPFLIQILEEDTENSVRQNAAIALGRSQNPVALAPLLNILTTPDTTIGRLRHCAAIALGELGQPTAIEPLVHAALYSKDSNLQSFATHSLVKLGGNSLDLLIQHLKSEEPLVRSNAVWSLGQFEDDRTLEALTELAENEFEDAKVRDYASSVIARIKAAYTW